MKNIAYKKITILILLPLFLFTQKAFTQKLAKQEVEISCYTCQFKEKGADCSLAIRLNGKSYLVKGSNIDDHGDSHAPDGFCNAIRKGLVTGKIKNGYFYANKITLLK